MQKILQIFQYGLVALLCGMLSFGESFAAITAGPVANNVGGVNRVITPLNLTTNADGASYVPFPSLGCNSITIFNGTGIVLLYQRAGATIGTQLGLNQSVTFPVTNANQISVKRNDAILATAVVVSAEATTLSSYSGIPTSSLTFAYSLNRLIPTYTGAAIRVRRVFDNTEQDIGFDSKGLLDQIGLKAFCNSSCFVKTWYDQSLTLDATQTVTTKQPRLVLNGIIDTMGGKPALFFNGTSSTMANSGTGLPTGSGAFTLNVRLQCTNPGYALSPQSWAMWGGNDLNTGISISRENASEMAIRTGNGQYVNRNESTNFVKSITLVNNSTTFRGFQNGIEDSNWLNLPPTYAITAGPFNIGANTAGFGMPFLGYISEMIFYNKALTDPERISLEGGQELRSGFRANYNIVFDGDSIMYAASGTTNIFNGFRTLWLKDLIAKGKTFRYVCPANIGYSSDDQDAIAKAPGGSDTFYLPPADKNILLVNVGQNDIGNKGRSPAVAYNFIKSYVANRKATGRWSRIVVFTTEPNFAPANSDLQLTLSSLMRVGMQPGGDLRAAGATDFVDKQAIPDPQYNPDVNNGRLAFPWADRTMGTNSIYKPFDQIHPGDYAHQLLYLYGVKPLNL